MLQLLRGPRLSLGVRVKLHLLEVENNEKLVINIWFMIPLN